MGLRYCNLVFWALPDYFMVVGAICNSTYKKAGPNDPAFMIESYGAKAVESYMAPPSIGTFPLPLS